MAKVRPPLTANVEVKPADLPVEWHVVPRVVAVVGAEIVLRCSDGAHRTVTITKVMLEGSK